MSGETKQNKIEITIPDCNGGELKLSHTGAQLEEAQEVFKAVTKYLGFETTFQPLKRKGSGG